MLTVDNLPQATCICGLLCENQNVLLPLFSTSPVLHFLPVSSCPSHPPPFLFLPSPQVSLYLNIVPPVYPYTPICQAVYQSINLFSLFPPAPPRPSNFKNTVPPQRREPQRGAGEQMEMWAPTVHHGSDSCFQYEKKKLSHATEFTHTHTHCRS